MFNCNPIKATPTSKNLVFSLNLKIKYYYIERFLFQEIEARLYIKLIKLKGFDR